MATEKKDDVAGSPGLRTNGQKNTRPDIITVQGKLPKIPTESEKEYFEAVKDAIEYFTAEPVGTDDKGAPIKLGRAWGNFRILVNVYKGIKSGKVKWDDVAAWGNGKKAEKPKAAAPAPKKAAPKAKVAKKPAAKKKPVSPKTTTAALQKEIKKNAGQFPATAGK